MKDSIRLDYPDGKASLYSLDDINSELSVIGTRAWTIDLSNVPTDIKQLLKKQTLSDEEKGIILHYFLLPMERLLNIIEDAGRTPNIPGGGEFSTTVSTFGYSYPQLYLSEEGVDYSRFDNLHLNVSQDGTGVDEVLQFVSGSEFVIHQYMPDKNVLQVHFSCPDENSGWMITYNGKNPHIGSLTSSSIGTKLIVQVIGPAEWEMKYI
ncbi:MAG: hypothetical protein ACR2NC_00580 [Thermodesulfobacteriota bacterium]